jgi:ABC-type multidrug transport system ATPase subunit/CRP-like cAMP-binding protein
MSQERSYFLNLHEAFSKLRPKVLHSIAKKGESFLCQKNENICQAGERADFLFFLLTGKVILYSSYGNKVLQLNEREGHFGWNEYEDNYAYTAVVNSEVASVFKIGRQALSSLFSDFKHLKDRLFIYHIPFGAYLFFKSFNLPGFNLDQNDFLTSFELEFFLPGEMVVKKGETADKFYMIVSGNANVTESDTIIVNTLKDGDYFGEIGLLEQDVRSANVIATSQLSVFSLSKKAFNQLLSTKKGRFIKNCFDARTKTYISEIERIFIGSHPDCNLRIQGNKIAPKHARLTKIIRKNGRVQYLVKPLAASSQYKVFINKQVTNKETIVDLDDEVSLGDYKVVFDKKRDAISLQKIEYYCLHVENLNYKVKNNLIIDDISFSAESNEFICILGPSGCGKSTLLDLIFGAKRQTSGNISYNHDILHENLEFYRTIFGYLPQDDILFSELTVFENLYFTAKLREPFIARKKLEKKIDIVLKRLKLSDKKHQRVGSIEKKGLSGGERKRVSIARELIFDPYILFLDEPTSGLSSKDSEEIICFLRILVDMGKLVFVVVHQPNSKIYKLFDKIVLLDMGGKLVYTGLVLDCIHYMEKLINDCITAECPECKTCQPELIFEILEQRDEKNERKYSPEFWQKRFQAYSGYLSQEKQKDPEITKHVKQKVSLLEHLIQLSLLLHRTFLIKIKNWSNMLISMGVPIVIATLFAIILRSGPEKAGTYSFYQNKLILSYIFIGVIFSIFLGLTNSVRDVVGEQAIYNLESKVKLRIRWYVFSKFFVLSGIAGGQIFLFVLICNFILDIRGVFGIFFIFLYLSSLVGVAFGLFLSSIVRTTEAVVNWIPLVLIPQIILGGAVIEFEDMSRYLYIGSEQAIPEICQLIPSRWAHEGLAVAQATLNPRDSAIDQSNKSIRNITKKIIDLRSDGQQNLKAIKRLEQERRKLYKKKGGIDRRYPNDKYKNEALEKAVLNGSGSYYSYNKNRLPEQPYKSFCLLTLYRLKKGDDIKQIVKKSVFNSPFYAEYKGISIGQYYFEIETVVFNAGVLILMTTLSILACMFTLKLKKLRP